MNANVSNKRPTEAFISENLFEQGIGHVVVSRFRSSGLTESGVFLLDIYCLGVKGAFLTESFLSDYEERVVKRIFTQDPAKPITPAFARKLIEQAVAYAQNLGFPPHLDYKKACRVLGGIRPEECAEEFTFGKHGKPLFIQGPHDSPARCELILKQLRRRCGEGNFHFIVLAH